MAEDGPQRFVAADDLPEAAGQDRRVERPAQLHGRTHVVERVAGLDRAARDRRYLPMLAICESCCAR